MNEEQVAWVAIRRGFHAGTQTNRARFYGPQIGPMRFDVNVTGEFSDEPAQQDQQAAIT